MRGSGVKHSPPTFLKTTGGMCINSMISRSMLDSQHIECQTKAGIRKSSSGKLPASRQNSNKSVHRTLRNSYGGEFVYFHNLRIHILGFEYVLLKKLSMQINEVRFRFLARSQSQISLSSPPDCISALLSKPFLYALQPVVGLLRWQRYG